jgi:hypothetical protein
MSTTEMGKCIRPWPSILFGAKTPPGISWSSSSMHDQWQQAVDGRIAALRSSHSLRTQRPLVPLASSSEVSASMLGRSPVKIKLVAFCLPELVFGV